MNPEFLPTPDEEHTAFEAWALMVLKISPDDLRKTTNGNYICDRVHYAWFGWRARATSSVPDRFDFSSLPNNERLAVGPIHVTQLRPCSPPVSPVYDWPKDR